MYFLLSEYSGFVFGIPVLMLAKISPSVEPWSHDPSTRLGGGGPGSNDSSGGSPPVPLRPWQDPHDLMNDFLPSASDCAVLGIGFLTAAAAFPCNAAGRPSLRAT